MTTPTSPTATDGRCSLRRQSGVNFGQAGAAGPQNKSEPVFGPDGGLLPEAVRHSAGWLTNQLTSAQPQRQWPPMFSPGRGVPSKLSNSTRHGRDSDSDERHQWYAIDKPDQLERRM